MACGVVFVSESVVVYSEEEIEKRIDTLPAMPDTTIRVFPQAWGSYDILGMYVPYLPMYRTRVEPSDTENIEIIIGAEHRGSQEIREQSKRFLQTLSGFVDEKNALQLQVTTRTDEKFPLLLVRADIEVVKMPTGQRFYGFETTARVGEILFPQSETYSFLERIRIQEQCPVYYYDDQKRLHCDINESQIQMILAQTPVLSLHRLERLAQLCIAEHQKNGELPRCDFVRDAYLDIQAACEKTPLQTSSYECERVEGVPPEAYFEPLNILPQSVDTQSNPEETTP